MRNSCSPTWYAWIVLLGLMLSVALPSTGIGAQDKADAKSQADQKDPKLQADQKKAADKNAADKKAKDQAAQKKEKDKNADQVIDDLLKKSKPKAGTSAKGTSGDGSAVSNPSAASKSVDNRVTGTAPDLPKTQLQSEGQFVINRRGKVILGKKGTMPMFLFSGDGKKSPEPPMILMPCRLVELAEQSLDKSGSHLTFIITGQIFNYRGANHLLPTMLRKAVSRGNLKP
jgi:hypothetical protein